MERVVCEFGIERLVQRDGLGDGAKKNSRLNFADDGRRGDLSELKVGMDVDGCRSQDEAEGRGEREAREDAVIRVEAVFPLREETLAEVVDGRGHVLQQQRQPVSRHVLVP